MFNTAHSRFTARFELNPFQASHNYLAISIEKMKQCHFCVNNIKIIDYKNSDLLRKFITTQARILSGKRTGTCASCQRQLTKAIKHARHLALLPFTLR
ncbi:MAG: 30S ribosomal protein S18 [Candidatus Ryanbacteria bacterium CG10_big_fil_rev_8_21_14_0_10_43_42]|uniref:Small ribosomal subunit protein bS18 n=1 Tax=Candidatus Ryanbacteria bacterium CG10_big_fil_rev_8_21_14_0_10_43_42 TaxID=1974864 RepID=A0A2M8KWU3_9BACT|nr:MAG: 30S ribosomal protein S18 [Candidatus Ryanbacteria bacterium CG10_big_fil_rev_8_21_14_0_10_43_42]